MKKRTFIKLSSAVITGSTVYSPLLGWPQETKPKNWAGNYQYSTDKLYSPASVEEVQTIVKKYNKLKVLGTRHCFNGIADSTDNLVSLKQLNRILNLDKKAGTITVEAGVSYGQLSPYLYNQGFAL